MTAVATQCAQGASHDAVVLTQAAAPSRLTRLKMVLNYSESNKYVNQDLVVDKDIIN